MDAATITVVKDGGFFGHPQSDMGNVGYSMYGVDTDDIFEGISRSDRVPSPLAGEG